MRLKRTELKWLDPTIRKYAYMELHTMAFNDNSNRPSGKSSSIGGK